MQRNATMLELVLDKVKLIAFDLDDTLLDTFQKGYARINAVGRQLGFAGISVGEFSRVYGTIPFPSCVTEWYDEVDPLVFELAYDKIGDCYPYDAFVDGSALHQSVKQMGYEFAILTNAPFSQVAEKLKRVGLVGKSGPDYLYSREDLPAPKPCGSAFEPLLDDSGFDPNEILYVGDAPQDFEAARAAGIWFLGVETGPHRPNSEYEMTLADVNSFVRRLGT